MRGYLDDRAAAGREVHARPDARSPLLGRIAPPLTADGRDWSVSFDIRATDNGWLQIDGAGDDPVLTEGVERPMYAGSGWIRAAGVSVGVQASQGFAAPRHSSDITLESTDHGFLDGPGQIVEVVACHGNWVLARWRIREPVRVRYRATSAVSRRPLVVQAWTTGICNIQETSCDMPMGDRPGSR